MENPPQVLAAKGREILKKAGYRESTADSASDFSVDEEYYQYAGNDDGLAERHDRIPSSVLGFWYRQSPRPFQRILAIPSLGGILPYDPPLSISGESLVCSTPILVRPGRESFPTAPTRRCESKQPHTAEGRCSGD